MTIKENAIYLAYPDKAVEKIAELEKENAELQAEKKEMQEKVKQILLDDNAEIKDMLEVVGLQWIDKKELEQLKAERDAWKKRAIETYCEE